MALPTRPSRQMRCQLSFLICQLNGEDSVVPKDRDTRSKEPGSLIVLQSRITSHLTPPPTHSLTCGPEQPRDEQEKHFTLLNYRDFRTWLSQQLVFLTSTNTKSMQSFLLFALFCFTLRVSAVFCIYLQCFSITSLGLGSNLETVLKIGGQSNRSY